MIKGIIDILITNDFYGVSKEVDIAKGKYAVPYTWKQAKQQLKRIWYGR
jgi:hypothetical protein